MDFEAQRREMVRAQLRGREIEDPRVLEAMGRVPREGFVLAETIAQAYADGPLSIGHGATISQPYIVALTLQLAGIEAGHRVLDVGTGSGYQAAVLAEMGARVVGIERVEALTDFARQRLAAAGYVVDVASGDGHAGRVEYAPFDAIVCGAAAKAVPLALVEQLRVGGRLVIPIGPPWSSSVLTVVTRTEDGDEREDSIAVRFVPLVE